MKPIIVSTPYEFLIQFVFLILLVVVKIPETGRDHPIGIAFVDISSKLLTLTFLSCLIFLVLIVAMQITLSK